MKLIVLVVMLFLLQSCSDEILEGSRAYKFFDDISILEENIKEICSIRSRVSSSRQANALNNIKVIFIENQTDRKCNDDDVKNTIEAFLHEYEYQLVGDIYLEVYEAGKFVLKKL